MSKADVARLVADLKTNETLRADLQAKGGSLASLVEFGRVHGYDFTLEDAKAYIAETSGRALSDDDLDAVAGGEGATVVAVMTGPVAIVVSGGGGGAEAVISMSDQVSTAGQTLAVAEAAVEAAVA